MMPRLSNALPVLALAAACVKHPLPDITRATEQAHNSVTTVLASGQKTEATLRESPPLCTISGWVFMDQIVDEDGNPLPTTALRDIENLMTPPSPESGEADDGSTDLDGDFSTLLAPGSVVTFTGVRQSANTHYMVPPERLKEFVQPSTAYEAALTNPNTDPSRGNPYNTSDQIGTSFWVDASVVEARCPDYYADHQPQ